MQSLLAKCIFLSFVFVTAMFTIFSVNEVGAEEKLVEAKSIGFEETTIIEFENNGKSEIQSFRIWLGKDNSFKSFKTEKGWTGKKTPQGVIVFTTSDPIKLGQSVKFGIKTDNTKPGINWKALDKNDQELKIGKTLVTESPSKPSIKDINKSTSVEKNGGMFSDSVFRLIPEKPNVGSTIRVIGERFASNQEYDFFLGNFFLASFETDENGHFIFTTQLPESQRADRVEFFVKDKQGNQKELSLRIGELESRIVEAVRLTISGLPPKINPGDVILITGTGNPGGTVTANVVDPEGKTVTSDAVSVNTKGEWSFETLVSIDTPLGKYSAEISDGTDTILKSWIVESSKTIHITPSQIKYEAGDILLFNGTGLPNQNVEVIFENPQGTEIYSDIIQTDNSGFFDFKFETEQSFVDGTYVVFAFQGDKSEIVFIGIGELPEVQLVAKMDKLNYNAGDTAIISLSGPTSATLTLLIIDPSDKNKLSDTITLGPDGRKDYELDLSGYASGVYTIVATRANAQTSEVFSVGLQVGSGSIDLSLTKEVYEPGDAMLILGNSGPNILVTLSLLDPDGNEVRVKETFTSKEGKFSEDSFRIPSTAVPGIWIIKAKSGPNFTEVEVEILPSMEEGMVVLIEGIDFIPGVGKIIKIKVLGAQQSGSIDIFSETQELIGHLEFIATSSGIVAQPWPVPNDAPAGNYTIKVKDGFNSAETSFVLEK